MDETSTNLTHCCRYARAEGRQRTHQATPLHGEPNVSGAVNGDVFAA